MIFLAKLFLLFGRYSIGAWLVKKKQQIKCVQKLNWEVNRSQKIKTAMVFKDTIRFTRIVKMKKKKHSFFHFSIIIILIKKSKFKIYKIQVTSYKRTTY